MNELTNFVLDAFLNDNTDKLNEYSGGESIPNDGNATTGKQWNRNWKEYDSESYYLKGLPDWNFVDKKPSKREQESAVDQKLPVDNQNDGVTTKYNRILKQNFPMPYINEMIRHEGNNWVVYNKNGTKKLGTHTTKKDALKQLRAIEMHKHMNEDMYEDPKITNLNNQKQQISTRISSEFEKINNQIDVLKKKKIQLRNDSNNRLEKINKELTIAMNDKDSRPEKNITETNVLTESTYTKDSIREYYNTLMGELKLKPLPIKFMFVKKWGINTKYKLDNFKPVLLMIDPIRLNDPAKMIIHEITHHIKLLNTKNPFKNDEDKNIVFTKLEKKLHRKFDKPEYYSILKKVYMPDTNQTPVNNDIKPDDNDDETQTIDKNIEKNTKSNTPKKTTTKSIIKKDDIENKNASNVSNVDDEKEKIKPNSSHQKVFAQRKHKRKTQDLMRKIKNPDTGKMIKIKSALRYPPDTKAHQAARIALKRQEVD